MMRIYLTSLHGKAINSILLLLIIFCIPNKSIGNIEKYDSLLKVYNTSPIDSIKIDALLKIAYSIESDSAVYDLNSNAGTYVQMANQLVNDSVSIDKLARIIDRYGVIFRNNGNYLSALNFHNLAQEIANRIDNKNINSIISNNIGVVYRRLDDYQRAIEYHIKALELAEETRNIKSQAIAINSIGNIQMLIGNLDESLENFKQSLILEQKLENLLGIAINLNNIGNVYSMKKDYSKALEYFNLSLDVNKEIKSQKGIAICYTDIGSVYEYQGNNSRALSFYLDALVINKVIDDKHGLAFSYLQVGELYAELGRYDKALEYLEPGLEIALKIGAKAFITDGYAALYRVNRARSNFEDAFNYLELSHQYHDSILNINIRKDIARLQIQYESERKENQIELLERNAAISELDDKRENVLLLLILSALIIAIGTVIFLSYYLINRNKTNRLLLEQNKRIEKAKKELDHYSKQLLIAKQEAEKNSRVKSEFLANMSHEIRTPLNSVIGFADILVSSVKDQAHLSKLNIIKSSGRTLLTLINDILDLSKIEAGKFIIDYEPINPEYIFEDVIQIFSHRAFEKNIDLAVQMSDFMPIAVLFNELRLRQILFNLVGNALKFTKDGSILVEAIIDKHESDNLIDLTIKVSDTGIGINKNEIENIFEPFHQSDSNFIEHGTGLGLTITKRLVEMMKGTIDLSSEVGKGTTFTVKFPSIQVIEADQDMIEYKVPEIEMVDVAKVLILSNDPDRCIVFSQLDADNSEKEIVSNLNDAKNSIKEKNVVIICSYTIEKAVNAIKVLRQCETIHKLNFIVISNDMVIDDFSDDKYIYWIKESVSNSNLVRTLNSILNNVTKEDKLDSYFKEFLLVKGSNQFINELNIIFEEQFLKSKETKMSSYILSFTNELQNFANRYNLAGLLKFCDDLNISANHFEIDDVEKLLSMFESNYRSKVEYDN